MAKAKPLKLSASKRAQRRQRVIAEIEAQVAALQAATSRRVLVLAATLRADIRDLIDDDGRLKRIQDLPENLRLAIADCDIDATTGRMRRVKLKDKVDAAEQLLRFMGEADKPEVVALLKAARLNMKRIAEVIEASQAMKEATKPPTGRYS